MKALVVSLLSGALLLPSTATSLSGQIRVEVDGWWRSGGHETEYAYHPYQPDARGARSDVYVEYEEGYRSRGGRVRVDHGREGRRGRARSRRVDHRTRVNWTAVDWRNVRFRDGRGRRHRGAAVRSAYVPDLYRLVGKRTYRRLERHADRIGAYGALNARWVRLDRGARVLQVRAGRVPLAELVDLDRDPRVERVWLNTPYRRW